METIAIEQLHAEDKESNARVIAFAKTEYVACVKAMHGEPNEGTKKALCKEEFLDVVDTLRTADRIAAGKSPSVNEGCCIM